MLRGFSFHKDINIFNVARSDPPFLFDLRLAAQLPRSAEVGGVAHGQELQNRSQTMYAILRRNNLDEPDTLLPDATPTSAPSDAGSSGGAG